MLCTVSRVITSTYLVMPAVLLPPQCGLWGNQVMHITCGSPILGSGSGALVSVHLDSFFIQEFLWTLLTTHYHLCRWPSTLSWFCPQAQSPALLVLHHQFLTLLLTTVLRQGTVQQHQLYVINVWSVQYIVLTNISQYTYHTWDSRTSIFLCPLTWPYKPQGSFKTQLPF